MLFNSISTWRRTATALVAFAAIAACSKKPDSQQTSSGSIDTAVLATSAATFAAGPGVHVTKTDAKSVTKALEFELTPENFAQFMAAADSIATLEHRDATVRAYLANNLDDAGSVDADAGLKWLQANAAVSNAIVSAGLSVRDYFIASIAIASASRFMNDVEAAPATPTLADNAEFLHSHQEDLVRLQALRDHKPTVTATP
jgi:hypothetical protein